MTATEMRSAEMSIRMIRAEEHDALQRLAERDSATAPTGSVLGVFAGGELVAAGSIETGRLVADPFSPTEDVRGLLARRMAQLGR